MSPFSARAVRWGTKEKMRRESLDDGERMNWPNEKQDKVGAKCGGAA